MYTLQHVPTVSLDSSLQRIIHKILPLGVITELTNKEIILYEFVLYFECTVFIL